MAGPPTIPINPTSNRNKNYQSEPNQILSSSPKKKVIRYLCTTLPDGNTPTPKTTTQMGIRFEILIDQIPKKSFPTIQFTKQRRPQKAQNPKETIFLSLECSVIISIKTTIWVGLISIKNPTLDQFTTEIHL